MRLENVSLSAGYSSNGLPGARSIYGAQSGLGGDNDFRGEATLAYRKRFRTSSFNFSYTPSRVQRTNFSQWNSTDHVVGLEYQRQFGRRWGLAFNGGAANTGLEQFWFRRPTLRRIENPPTTFDELLQRVDAGEFTDDEFASILTGAPIVDDPGGRELDLSRVRSLNSTLSMSYAQSARSTITFGGGISEFNSPFRTGLTDSSDRTQVNNISRQHVFAQSEYRVNAGTTAGARYTGSQNSSTLGDAQAHSSVFFMRKRLSRFWTAAFEGGIGATNLDETSGVFRGLQSAKLGARATWVAGGSLDYRYGGHSLTGSFQRRVGDPLGLAARSTLLGSFQWQWTNPRMPWVFTGGASYQSSDFGFTVFDDTSLALETSLVQGAVTRRLSPSTAFTTGYYFGRFNSPLRGLLTSTAVHRVQATFLWRPVEPR